MKAYPVELRERIVGFVNGGGSRVDAARHFKISRQTVYRYLAAQQGGSLASKPQGGSPKRITDKKIRNRFPPYATIPLFIVRIDKPCRTTNGYE